MKKKNRVMKSSEIKFEEKKNVHYKKKHVHHVLRRERSLKNL